MENLTLSRPLTVTDTAKAQLVRNLNDQVAETTRCLADITAYAALLAEFEFTDSPDKLVFEAQNVFRAIQQLQRKLTSSVDQDAFTIIASAATLIRA